MRESLPGPEDEDADPADPAAALGGGWLVEGAAAGAVAAAAVDYGAVGGVVAAVATPAVVALLAKAAEEWRRGSEKRQQRVVTEAAAWAGLSAEDLLATVVADPALLLLLSRALAAAAGTVLDAKVVALGRALASGALADDPAALQGQALIVDVLARLEAPHVRLLDAVAAGTTRSGGDVDGPTEVDLAATIHAPVGGGPATGGVLLQPLLRTLDGEGLVYQVSIGATWEDRVHDEDLPGMQTSHWAVTGFGRALLELLHEAGRRS